MPPINIFRRAERSAAPLIGYPPPVTPEYNLLPPAAQWVPGPMPGPTAPWVPGPAPAPAQALARPAAIAVGRPVGPLGAPPPFAPAAQVQLTDDVLATIGRLPVAQRPDALQTMQVLKHLVPDLDHVQREAWAEAVPAALVMLWSVHSDGLAALDRDLHAVVGNERAPDARLALLAIIATVPPQARPGLLRAAATLAGPWRGYEGRLAFTTALLRKLAPAGVARCQAAFDLLARMLPPQRDFREVLEGFNEAASATDDQFNTAAAMLMHLTTSDGPLPSDLLLGPAGEALLTLVPDIDGVDFRQSPGQVLRLLRSLAGVGERELATLPGDLDSAVGAHDSRARLDLLELLTRVPAAARTPLLRSAGQFSAFPGSKWGSETFSGRGAFVVAAAATLAEAPADRIGPIFGLLTRTEPPGPSQQDFVLHQLGSLARADAATYGTGMKLLYDHKRAFDEANRQPNCAQFLSSWSSVAGQS